MPEPQRVTGFMPLAREVVTNEPGLTAKEVYSRVDRLATFQEIPISAAADPKVSLIGTLHKVYGDFGMKKHPGKDGIYRFYPK